MADTVDELDEELRQDLAAQTRAARLAVLQHRRPAQESSSDEEASEKGSSQEGSSQEGSSQEGSPQEGSPQEDGAENTKLLELEMIRAQLAAVEGKRSLLLFDPTGPGCLVAIGVGDVATAQHVSVYVPGNHTTVLRSLKGMAVEAKALARTANELLACRRPGEQLAAVFWLGYRCPQFDSAVLTEARAQEAVPALRKFLSELVRLRGDDQPHWTLLGHSYGSLVAGLTVWLPTRVDDVVAVGSPGVGTADPLGDWQYEGRMWALRAKGDAIASVERFGPSPEKLSGVVRLATAAGSYTDCAGEAQTLASIDVSGRNPFNRSHLRYNEPGTTSHFNQAMVAAGLTADLVLWRPERG